MQSQSLITHQTVAQAKRTPCLPYTKASNPAFPTPNSNMQTQSWPMVLPPGWKREECLRTSGLGTGKPDVYYVR